MAAIPSQEELARLILETVRDLGADLGWQGMDNLSEETILFGGKAILDSMGLVHLTAELEARLRERHGLDVVIADERAMSQRMSPFRRVSTLAAHIRETAAANHGA